MNTALLYQENLTFLRRGPALSALFVLLLTLLYAGWSGDRWRDARIDELDAFKMQAEEALGEFRAQLAGIEAGTLEPEPYDANPMNILFPAILPPASLADFAVGHADLHPAMAEISNWRNQSSVFGRYQFDNPTTLSSSAFDVATVVIVVLPLLMIAVSFDVLAGDRSRGSLGMLRAAPVRLRELVWTRLLFRNGLLWAFAAILMLVLALANDDGGDRFSRLAIWFGISALYLAFWLAFIAFCVARFRSATATAGALVGAWLVFTLALPASIATLTEALYPTPSRLAFLSEIRTAQADTNRNLAKVTEGFLMDHPELSVGDDELPSFLRAAFLSNEAARENTQATIEAYDSARSGRDRTVRWAQYLSPAVIAQRLLHLSAGADLGRQHRFQAQVQQSLHELAEAVGPSVVSRNRLPLETFDELRPFDFSDVSVADISNQAAGPGLFLLLVAGAFGVAATRRLDADEGGTV